MKTLILAAFFSILFSSPANAFEGCREKLANRVFAEDSETGALTPITDPAILNMFTEAYDLYPLPVQVLMCQFTQFRLYKADDGASAYSNMSFRRGPFDKNLSAEQWMTWKDQLNFGTPNNNEFVNDPTLAHVEVDARIKGMKFLYFLLVHEIGHNTPRFGTGFKWEDLFNRPENEFEGKEQLCSYWCEPGKAVPSQKSESVYGDLFEKTNYLSLYTTRNFEEDFADSFAFYVATQISGYSYDIVTPNGKRFEVREKMKSPLFAEKLAILKSVYDQLPLEISHRDFEPMVLRIEE